MSTDFTGVQSDKNILFLGMGGGGHNCFRLKRGILQNGSSLKKNNLKTHFHIEFEIYYLF